MRAIFDKLSNSYAKYYSVTEHLAVDEIIVLFKGRVIWTIYILRQYSIVGLSDQIEQGCQRSFGHKIQMKRHDLE
jgi:hypothetical protein